MEKFNKLHEEVRKAMYIDFFYRIGEAASEYYAVDANTRKLGIALTKEQDAQLMKNIAEKWEIDAESINDYVLGFNTQEELAEKETDAYFAK